MNARIAARALWLTAGGAAVLTMSACGPAAERGVIETPERQRPTASAAVALMESPSPTPRPTYAVGDPVTVPEWTLTVVGSADQPGGRTDLVVAQELATKTGMSVQQALQVVRGSGSGRDSVMLRAGVAPADPNAAVPEGGMRFVAVTVTLANADHRVQTTDPADFRLQDSNGIRREPLSARLRSDALGRVELASGGRVTGSLVFEAPADDQSLSLVFGSGADWEVVVKLVK